MEPSLANKPVPVHTQAVYTGTTPWLATQDIYAKFTLRGARLYIGISANGQPIGETVLRQVQPPLSWCKKGLFSKVSVQRKTIGCYHRIFFPWDIEFTDRAWQVLIMFIRKDLKPLYDEWLNTRAQQEPFLRLTIIQETQDPQTT